MDKINRYDVKELENGNIYGIDISVNKNFDSPEYYRLEINFYLINDDYDVDYGVTNKNEPYKVLNLVMEILKYYIKTHNSDKKINLVRIVSKRNMKMIIEELIFIKNILLVY